mmetsp:Transcript_50124/g.119304  ORF Transcript_50124/g.119304 Transcript_50124/m.119304 type:complete len:200 (+) Transcript_50124:1527-2126(+)
MIGARTWGTDCPSAGATAACLGSCKAEWCWAQWRHASLDCEIAGFEQATASCWCREGGTFARRECVLTWPMWIQCHGGGSSSSNPWSRGIVVKASSGGSRILTRKWTSRALQWRICPPRFLHLNVSSRLPRQSCAGTAAVGDSGAETLQSGGMAHRANIACECSLGQLGSSRRRLSHRWWALFEAAVEVSLTSDYRCRR